MPVRSRIIRWSGRTFCAMLVYAGCAAGTMPAPPLGARSFSPTAEACRERKADLRRATLDVHERQKNIGLAVAIRRDGQLVFSEGFGLADLENAVPVDPRTTRFAVASVTKAFTGLALLKAVERGRIDLDAPIQRYVPTFPVKSEGAISPRLLAAHLAGIRHWKDERTPALYARHFRDVNEILPLFAADALVAAPGSKYSYSSYGYDLLGAALQAAYGKPYPQVIADEVFTPLGLQETAFDDVRKVVPHRARHYTYYDLDTFAETTEPLRVPDWDYSHNLAAGNVISTAEDLVQFGDLLASPGYLSGESLDLLYTRPRSGAVESPMSFGWFVSDATSPSRHIYITGSNAGIQAGLFVYPDRRLVIAIVSNTWGVGSRSGELVGNNPADLPSRLASMCGQ
jgi:serine beta-lactamase-like protein LACTB